MKIKILLITVLILNCTKAFSNANLLTSEWVIDVSHSDVYAEMSGTSGYVGCGNTYYARNANISQTIKLQRGKYYASCSIIGPTSGNEKAYSSCMAYILTADNNKIELSKARTFIVEYEQNVTFLIEFVKEYEGWSSFSCRYSISNCQLNFVNGLLTASTKSHKREYGENNPDFKVEYSGFIDGDDESVVTEPVSVSCEATATSSVGQYPITLSGGVCPGYEISYRNGTLEVQRANVNVTADDASREYGEENPEVTLHYSGFKNGEKENVLETPVKVATSATKTSTVGQYPITLSGAVSKNYSFSYTPAKLTVTKAPLTGRILDAEKNYGSQNPQFDFAFNGLKNDELKPTWNIEPTIQTEAITSSNVGEYVVSATGGEPVNYELYGITDGYLTVKPVPLTIKAIDAKRYYFAENPTFYFSATGFVNGDTKESLTKQPTFTTTAQKTSNVGDYPLTVSGASSPNYTISYTEAKLTIEKRKLTVTANDETRKYKEKNPAFTYYYNGFVNNEDESVLLSLPKVETTANEMSDCGEYPIIISGAEAENYTFSYNNGTLVIQKIEQEVIWNQDFVDVKVGDQIPLTAEATSGLEVEYIINDNSCASIYKAAGKTYLDCFGSGDVVIRAVQEGNINYYSTPRVSKTIHIEDPSGINSVSDSKIRLEVDSGVLTIKGKAELDTVFVYDMTGKLLYKGVCSKINVGKGIKLVRIGNKRYKIIVP